MSERRVVERRGGLGRGLAALIPTGPPAEVGASAAPASATDAATDARADPTAILFGGPRPGARARRPMFHVKHRRASAYYREIDVAAIEPNPQQPRSVFDEEALAELEHSIREFGLLQPVVVREAGPRPLPARHGRATLAGGAAGRAAEDPGHRPADGRRHPAARRAAGEHPPRPAQPAGGGGGLRAAARRVRGDAQRAGRSAGSQPSGRDEHDPAAQAADDRATPGGRRRALGRPRAGAARPGGRGASRRTWRRGSWPRGCRCGRPRRRCSLARTREAGRAAAAAPEADRRIP